MKTLVPSVALFVFALVFAPSVHAQAKIDDCEKIQAADAYNQCLAKFGPPAKTGNLEPERPGDIKSSSAEAAASAGKARGHGRAAARRGGRVAHHARGSRGHATRGSRGGRKRMTISVGK